MASGWRLFRRPTTERLRSLDRRPAAPAPTTKALNLGKPGRSTRTAGRCRRGRSTVSGRGVSGSREGGYFTLPTPDGKHILVQPQPSLSAYAAQGLMLLDADTGLRVRAFEDGWRVPKMIQFRSHTPGGVQPGRHNALRVPTPKITRMIGGGYDNIPCKRGLLVWDVARGS